MTTTYCTSGAVVLKAGINAPLLTDFQYAQLINQAESFVNVQSRYNWIPIFSTLGSGAALIIEDATSSYAAMNVAGYDPSGYSSRQEFQTILDINWSKVVECINLLRDEKFKTFVLKGVVA